MRLFIGILIASFFSYSCNKENNFIPYKPPIDNTDYAAILVGTYEIIDSIYVVKPDGTFEYRAFFSQNNPDSAKFSLKNYILIHNSSYNRTVDFYRIDNNYIYYNYTEEIKEYYFLRNNRLFIRNDHTYEVCNNCIDYRYMKKV